MSHDRSADLAQVNIARLLAPLDSAQLHDFVAALDEVNAEADAAPGFCWRLQAQDGNATSIVAFAWDVHDTAGVIVNLSTWQSPQALHDFMVGGQHVAVMRRRREWFHHVAEATTALWWVPRGHRPSTQEAEDRLRLLRQEGPSPKAFSLAATFTAEQAGFTA